MRIDILRLLQQEMGKNSVHQVFCSFGGLSSVAQEKSEPRYNILSTQN